MHAIKKTQTILIGFLCVFLLPSLTHAQLPIMFDSNYVSFYLPESDDGITISEGGRLQYHFIQQTQQLDSISELKFNKHLDNPTLPNNCFYLTKSSLAGNYAHLNNVGDITVFNTNQEPIFFKLNSALNSSWLMYENRKQNNVIRASIISIGDSSIFNSMNEIKSIQVVYYDTLGQEKKQEKYNRFVFKYGDKIGFLRLCYLGSFPLTCLNESFSKCGVLRFMGYQNMEGTVKHGKTFFHVNEVHDYEVEDEFHSVNNYHSQYLSSSIKTINVCMSKKEVNDSLFFVFKERKHKLITDRNGSVPIITDTVEEREHQVSRPVFTARPFIKTSYLDLLKTVYSSNIKGGLDEYYWNASNSMYVLGDTCFRQGFTNYEIVVHKYKGVFGSDIPNTIGGGEERIVYYRKGSKTWGIPLPQNIGVNEIVASQRVSVYPNPANKMAIIDITKAKQVRIVNSLGKWVNTTSTIDQSKVEINTETLTNGIYYIELITERGTSRGTLVVEH